MTKVTPTGGNNTDSDVRTTFCYNPLMPHLKLDWKILTSARSNMSIKVTFILVRFQFWQSKQVKVLLKTVFVHLIDQLV